jgi:hypothetical protein
MKTKIRVKEFSDLPSEVVQIGGASAPAVPESSSPPNPESHPTNEGFREMLQRRYANPYPQQRWGLNE